MGETVTQPFRCPRCGAAGTATESHLGTWELDGSSYRWTLTRITCASGCALTAADITPPIVGARAL